MAGGEGFSKTEKNRMLLSASQMTGVSAVHTHVHVYIYIRICMLHIHQYVNFHSTYAAKSFIELVRYHFSLPKVKENHLA